MNKPNANPVNEYNNKNQRTLEHRNKEIKQNKAKE